MFSLKKRSTKEKVIESILLDKYNSFYRMAMSYTHNEADAADIVQEGAYRAIRNADGLKNTDYAATWIYRIMMNEIYRYGSHKYTDSLDALEGYEEGKEDVYEDADLEAILDQLDPKDQAVIVLKYFEELKLKEIAEILDENENTIKSRLYRSLKKLKQNMEAEGYDR